MSSNLIAIAEDKTIAAAEALMKMNNIRHLPVVDSLNELSGIISVNDTAKAKNKKEKVKTIMTSRVRVVKKTANIKTIIEQMLKFKISSMVVASESDVVGIVTTDDLIKLLYTLLDEDENMNLSDPELDFSTEEQRNFSYPVAGAS